VRATRFPETQQGRQNVAHVVRLPSDQKADSRPTKPEKAKPAQPKPSASPSPAKSN
jgi:hypothetical protein